MFFGIAGIPSLSPICCIGSDSFVLPPLRPRQKVEKEENNEETSTTNNLLIKQEDLKTEKPPIMEEARNVPVCDVEPSMIRKLHSSKGRPKVKWTPAEDELLTQIVQIRGTKNWIDISMLIPGRNAKQCRERWTSKLDPSINQKPFTDEEDKLILDQHKKIGSSWAKIAKLLVGRSSISVKNRYNLLIRRSQKLEKEGKQRKNLITPIYN